MGFEPADKTGSTAEKRRATERRFYAIKFFKNSANKIPLFRPLNTSRLKRRLFLSFPIAYKSSNVQLLKSAIFVNLRTLEQKNLLFSILVPWESKPTIPEKRILSEPILWQNKLIFFASYEFTTKATIGHFYVRFVMAMRTNTHLFFSARETKIII